MPGDFVALAKVGILADMTGFRASLVEGLATTSLKPVPIKVTPDMKGFQTALREAVAISTKSIVARIQVRPNMTGFRAALLERVQASSRGVAVRVPVLAGQAGAVPAAAGRGAGESGLTAEQRALREQQDRAAASARNLERAQAEGLTLEEQQAQVERTLTGIRKQLETVTLAQTVAQNANNVSMAESYGLLISNLEATTAKASAAKADVLATAQQAGVQKAADLAIAEANILLATNVDELTTKAAVQNVANKISSTDAALTNLLARARQLDATATAAEVEAIQAKVIALSGEVEAQRAALASGSKRITQEALIARGAGATGLSLLNIRGATLAASYGFLAGAAAATIMAKAIGSAAGLQTQLKVFQVTAQATTADMEAVRKKAIQLGADITLPGVNARDAADTMTELAKAGLSVRDSMDAARGTLQLATAAEIDNAQATEIVANALNVFKLGGSEATRVADLLANASIQAQGSIADMGSALTQVASVSKLVGISVEDTVALITLLAKNGLTGAQAGTTLRVALIRLLNPAAAAAAELKKLNVEVRDINGNVRPDIFAQLSEATAHYSKAQRDAAFATIFGTRAIRAQAILGGEGAGALDEMRLAVQRAGAAEEIAHARTSGLAGQVEALKNNLATLGITIGNLTIPPLTALIQKVNEALGPVNALASGIENLIRAGSKIHIPPINVEVKVGPIHKDVNTEKDGKTIGQRLGQIIGFAIKDEVRRALETLPGVKQIETVLFGKKVIENRFFDPKPVKADLESVRLKVKELFDEFNQRGAGTTALNQLLFALKAYADQLDKLGPKGQQEAARVRAIAKELVDLGPAAGLATGALKGLGQTDVPPINLKVQLDPKSIANIPFVLQNLGKNGSNDFFNGLSEGLQQQPVIAFPESIFQGLIDQAEQAGKDAQTEFITSFTENLGVQIAVAEAEGASDQTLLGLHQQRLAEAQARLRQRQAREAGFIARGKKPPPWLEQQIEQAAHDVSTEKAAIKSIGDKQKQSAKEQADAIIKARNEHDQKIVDAFASGEAKRRNVISAKALTKGLKDDIAANIALRNFIRNYIDHTIRTIKDAKTRAQALVQAKADLIAVKQTIKNLQAEQKATADQIAQNARDLKEESLNLDVQIAQTTGNKAAEERALKAEIAFYLRQAHNQDLTAIERKRYLLKLRQAERDLKDLTAQLKKNQFAAMSFAFLQAQTGFVSQLASNVIGLGASFNLTSTPSGSSGASGGGIPPANIDTSSPYGGNHPSPSRASASATAEQRRASGGKSPPSESQLDQLIHLSRQTVRLLQQISRASRHPEAKVHRDDAPYKVETHGY